MNTSFLGIPPQLVNLKSLEVLKCNVSKHEFDSIICKLTNLIELKIYSDSLDFICKLDDLKNLKSFYIVLYEERFVSFECSIKNLKNFGIAPFNCCCHILKFLTK